MGGMTPREEKRKSKHATIDQAQEMQCFAHAASGLGFFSSTLTSPLYDYMNDNSSCNSTETTLRAEAVRLAHVLRPLPY